MTLNNGIPNTHNTTTDRNPGRAGLKDRVYEKPYETGFLEEIQDTKG